MSILYWLFICFTVFTVIQTIYYVVFLKGFAFFKEKSKTLKSIPVSIIICAKNEAENLEQNLPSIIEQEYENFEIILINDASQDDTLEVMERFKAQHNNIKIVDVKTVEQFWGNKKYALTLGIKASTHEFLLFTDADCKPVSKYWLQEMASGFSNENHIVLGFGGYEKVKHSLLNKLIRFETLMTAIQYFTYANLGMPYMGVGRNLAYKKTLFFNNSGFMSHMDIKSGDDDLFINQVANSKNTITRFSENGFTLSIPKTTFSQWVRQKRRHISTAKHYKPKHKFILGLFYFSQLFFWLLAILLLVFQYHWKLVASIVIFRLLLQLLTTLYSSKKLNCKDLVLFAPFLEFFLIIFQMYIFSANLISKPHHWK